ncbi:MAG: class I SAM-dependent methyltransferase [Clostridiales bacterium]|nr:class I SAM-dependent methyltransferase [Clostridiales bacterium]
MYEEFAYIYDMMMDGVDYPRWADYLEELFFHYKVSPDSILDLACGTGSMTINMAGRDYKTTGIDGSEDMLFVAQEKARKRGLRIPFICQDIRDIEIHKRVDAVLIVCDGLNYITSDEDLDKVFSNIHRILKPGGVLLFDISSYYKLSTVLGDNILIEDDHKISCLWQNSFDWEEDICTMDLTFFVREGSLYRRFDETHIQKAYRPSDIVDRLEKNDFVNINYYDFLTLDPPGSQSQRIQFAARRKS